MNRNTISLAGTVGSVPKTLKIRGDLTYTSFVLYTHGSHCNESKQEVSYHETHHIVCVGTLDSFARSIKLGAEIEVEGELRTRRHTSYIGDPVEVQIVYWHKEVVAASIRPHASYVATRQEAHVDHALIALYRPEEL